MILLRKNILRGLLLICLSTSLSGCFYWVRAYQTYLQMDEFDKYFATETVEEFGIIFKDPRLYSDDFISLSRLQPSLKITEVNGPRWRYWFRKVDQQDQIANPEVRFYFDLNFNHDQRLIRWEFSSLFLQIAPAEFLEASFRSLGGGKIDQQKRQLRANTDSIKKISSRLPQKDEVIRHLGAPLTIKQQADNEEYHYKFLLETRDIEPGYEDRAFSAVKLIFDKSSRELMKMSGRFAGLKISIDYRKYQADSKQLVVGLPVSVNKQGKLDG